MPQADSLITTDSDTSAFVFQDTETDSLLPLLPTPSAHRLFASEHPGIKEMIPIPREKPVADWITLTLIFITVYYTALFLLNSKSLGRLIKAFYNLSLSNQLVRDENLTIQRTSVLLSVGYYAITGLLLYRLSEHYSWMPEGIHGFLRFFLISAFLAVLYFLKIILVRLLGFVFNAARLADNYVFNIILIKNISGLALLPLMLFEFYSAVWNNGLFMYTGLGLIAACWLYRISRGVITWLSAYPHSVLYLIFYICSLEIAPLLILIKII